MMLESLTLTPFFVEKSSVRKWIFKRLFQYGFGWNQVKCARITITYVCLFKHILLARTVDIIKQMLTIWKLQGLEWKQHAYRIPFLKHVCFHALAIARPLRRCLNTWPNGLVFKQLPWDLANVNVWKNMCDPYIIQLMHPFEINIRV